VVGDTYNYECLATLSGGYPDNCFIKGKEHVAPLRMII
jgi:hypothetical protein